jgi:hypothetical protein
MYNRAKVVFFSGIEKRLSHKVADKYQKNISPTHTTQQITPQTPTLVTLKPAQYHTISGVISNKKQPKFRAKQQRKTTPFSRLKTPNFSGLFTVLLLSLFGYYNHKQYNKTTESVSANK